MAHMPLIEKLLDTILTYIAFKPRIVVPKHPSQGLEKILFIPIKGNQILLFAKYSKFENESHLHLSIHEIRSDNRVGLLMWVFNNSVDGHFDIDHWVPIKSTENALGITFWARYNDHWKLFDISTTETCASDDFPLIESGEIDFDLNLNSKSVRKKSLVILSPDQHVLLNVDQKKRRHNEIIDIHYSDSGGTNGMNFSFVTRMSIPIPPKTYPILRPLLSFSADGSKFAMTVTAHGRVSVWGIRSKFPLKTFMEVPKSDNNDANVRYLQFSSGKLGKEALVFVEHNDLSLLNIIHVIDATSFETEEILLLDLEELKEYDTDRGVGSLFFDPNGETLYAELAGTLYEWDLRKNEPGLEWWIGE
ncbi:uncharacterized protein LACBIDRAFT_330332 [Laccaria bicolor S238N-H82]|uniref:Predicted protein n=1 Tax=Laccaria bicolor (strain S238N-H82 / ATCC MYA-4686) TaxID=486041 RepID=B0DKY6_LACBS|nr:uncharacterized protein LACBIDRAFT_330332 [Laccaria bicolor S238N-H82]EDR04730.1 predicted protein [Laccaria bicolor S238N-H82]|eukprot:XP_001884554.1 predicted protein [Laccaria bicolor S238N-H82]